MPASGSGLQNEPGPKRMSGCVQPRLMSKRKGPREAALCLLANNGASWRHVARRHERVRDAPAATAHYFSEFDASVSFISARASWRVNPSI
ncbi:hypothetical protein LMG24238_03812 [Paraburkholderia sediminicola]|uniref:Uncharacterized protein n=1 Tax=Paraburkholderia sediminicola TaxID=458836 RepID=A0A6J5BFI8_9BURK|nr:hypothetical protein LMG24238_03812 [Paraburkholderia sediminicola]